MTIQRLIELLKALVDSGAISEETVMKVDVPDEDYSSYETTVYGIAIYNNGSVVLKVNDHTREESNG